MPSKKQYNLVSDDAYDSRIPLHSEEAFQHGIAFHAKYIGTLDVPRPSSRVEIVAAMRRIRYEFKAKAIKKKKVTITISVEGVKVSLRKKKKKNQWSWDDSRFMIMHHPVYRIFYVSHDSQDLKIFSYIARDGGSNVFKCNVFKSSKKSQAMRIVRTVGQAFEVCHKLSLAHATSVAGSQEEVINEKSLEAISDVAHKEKLQKELEMKNSSSTDEQPKSQDVVSCRPPKLELLVPPDCQQSGTEPSESYSSPTSELLPLMGTVLPEGTPLSIYHQVQLLKEQLEQQAQHTQTAIAQVQLLKDQLSAESTARLEAQAQNHQLLVHNKELLEHIRVLVQHIQDLEKKLHQLEGKSDPPLPDLPALRSIHAASETSTSSPGPVHLPDFLQMEHATSTTSSKFSTSPIPMSLLQNTTPCSPSGSPRPSNTSQDQSIFSGLSLPSSPTQLGLPPSSNLEDLLKHSSLKSGSPRIVRNRSPVYGMDGVIPNNDSNVPGLYENNGGLSISSGLPRLHPPPHKLKTARATQSSEQLPNGSKPSHLPNDTYRQDVLSWPPSGSDPLTATQMNMLLKQYSLPASQQPNNQENFFSQALRDLTKLNLIEKDKNAFRSGGGLEAQMSPPLDASLSHLFKS